jgi:hypothetical protein
VDALSTLEKERFFKNKFEEKYCNSQKHLDCKILKA